ncbi:hypothetical protein BJX68DRAFT_271890 [Aspergillus pseudodeflectus]|uniref:Uncharacterized protein n=1 Tax=Aspergillus pseudodeflectus TaxID=176178 RepID=A0ABR4JJ17_9EURO
MLQVSGAFIKEMLGYCKSKDIDLTSLDAVNLNSLIESLDKEKDYQKLAWLLTALSEKRQKTRARGPDSTYTLALGRMLAITYTRSAIIRLQGWATLKSIQPSVQ